MNIEDIRCVLIIGAGTMGQKIALQCALCGYQVIVYDVSPKALETAAAAIKNYAAQLVGQKRRTPDESNAALVRISFTTDPDEGAKADLVNESVFEDPDLKGKVFAQFDKICPPHTLFTTNTSTLAPSKFSDATGRPDRFAALHFYGVWDSNLVDIMPHPGTLPETMELLYAFAKRIGQIPLVFKKESPKYVVNAILGAINEVVLNLVSNGTASVEDIDRAYMIVFGSPIGPFGQLDGVGLDTVWHVAKANAPTPEALENDPKAKLIKEYVDKVWLGVKTGRGFYTYPDPAYARSGFLTGEDSEP